MIMTTPVEIDFNDLKSRVDAGAKRKELAEHYNLPETAVARLLKEAGLKIRKLQTPKYILVNKTDDPGVEEVQVNDVEIVVPEETTDSHHIGDITFETVSDIVPTRDISAHAEPVLQGDVIGSDEQGEW